MIAIGDICEFQGPRPKKQYGQWTVTRIEQSMVYASGSGRKFNDRLEMAMCHEKDDELRDTEYKVVVVSNEEPCEPEDWS